MGDHGQWCNDFPAALQAKGGGIMKQILNSNYYITEFGNVYNSKTHKVLNWCDNGTGYMYVTLLINGKRKNYTIHRLVAEAFVSNPNNLPTVNHIDGNKLNNHYSNLEWCTVAYNNQHAVNNGLRNTIHINMRDLQGNLIASFNSIRDANDYLGINHNSTLIYECLFNRRKYKRPIYKGYLWEYLNGGNNGEYK